MDILAPTLADSGVAFGEYRLLRRLGAGGMAEVFLAKREGPGGFEKQLVIKRVLPHLSKSERFTSMFLKEARLAALVDHPNLVHVSSFGEIDGEYYLAMEYVDGLTLVDLLARTGTPTPGVCCRIAVDLLAALEAIHEAKLVHRDVSPKNLMLTRAGAVKLLDFGIAITAEDEGLVTMGTRRYMAPEQMLGEPVDHRADLFAVGVVLYELFVGRPPYDGLPQRLPEQPESIPDPVWAVIRQALAILPDGRPTNARAMQRPLEVYLAERGLEGTRGHLADLVGAVSTTRARPRSVLSRLTRLTGMTGDDGAEPGPRPLGVALLFALGAAIAAATTVLLWPDDPPPAPPPAVAAEPPAQPPPTPVAATTTTAVAEAPVERTTRTPKKRRKRARRPGKLTIDTTPWTVVYLGDRKLGMTPLQGVKLPAGKHRLRLANPKTGLSKSIVVTIRPGRVTRVRRTL